MSRVPGLDLTTGAARLIAAEHLLSEYLPRVTSAEQLHIVQQIRDLLDGTTAIEEVA